MILLEKYPKKVRLDLVRGCEPFFITYRSPKWQNKILSLLVEEFGRCYEIPIRTVLTSASKAKRQNLTGSQFTMDFMKFKKANTKTNKSIDYVKTKELLGLMEDKEYLTILKGYYKNKDDNTTTCLRFNDKLLDYLDKKHCDKWGMSRLEGFKQVEVVDTANSTKNKKVFHSLKKFKGIKTIDNEVTLVNNLMLKSLITYKNVPCSVLYKRRFEDDLFNAGRWYVVGTFQIEDSNGRSTIEINNQVTTETDITHLHPSLLATRSGLKLPKDYDPYDIYDKVKVGHVSRRDLRNFMKKAFMALIYARARYTALYEIRTELWENPSIATWLDENTILETLEEHNSILKDYFYKKDNWKLCQYLDSSIATHVMVSFAKRSIVCLNYHDSWIVQKQYQPDLIEYIKEGWLLHVGNLDNFSYDIKF